MNWTAPCTISAAHQQSAIRTVGFCGHESSCLLGALVLPTFGHKELLLWQEEQLVLKNCATQSLFVDRKFCIFYKERPDDREQRPTVLDGRFPLPNHLSDKQYPWRGGQLWKYGRTEPVEMPATRDLVILEEVGDNPLPSDLTGSMKHSHNDVQGGKKYEQLGVDACTRVLASLVDGLSLDGDGAWLLLDAHDLSVSAKTETVKHKTAISQLAIRQGGLTPKRQN